MMPIVDGLEEQYNEKVQFVRLNVNAEGAEAFRELNLPGHPTVVIFNAVGEEVYRGFGVIPEAQLERELDAL